MRCVAAAIFNEFGEPVGGISVSGPTVRVTPERLAAIGPVVREAAADVTRMIGGVAPAEHDPHKWESVLGKDHGQTKG